MLGRVQELLGLDKELKEARKQFEVGEGKVGLERGRGGEEGVGRARGRRKGKGKAVGEGAPEGEEDEEEEDEE